MPPQHSTTAQTAESIHQALNLLAAQTPALSEIIAAFGPLKAAQAQIKAGLPALDSPLPQVDADRLAQGVPLATVEDLLSSQGLDLAEYLAGAAEKILPALQMGFPALRPDLEALAKTWDEYKLAFADCLRAVLGGRGEELKERAEKAGISLASLEFIVLQMAKPLLERRAQAMATLLPQLEWNQGSCPVCGSLPEMAFLQGEGGQRWLRCSLCAHHWRFARTACPVCGNQDHDKLEFFFAEGQERQRVDFCRQCGKYVVTLDARGLDAPPVWEVAALGLVHLDLLAQERGLTPAAWCAWNQVK